MPMHKEDWGKPTSGGSPPRPKWEEVAAGLERLSIPEGWIYRCERYGYGTITFVPRDRPTGMAL